MKVLFLDVDGVLNSVQAVYFYHRRNKGTVKTEWNPYEEFCPIAISNLVGILEAVPDLKIVVSSTWRLGCVTADDLRKIFDPIPLADGQKLIKDAIIDRTPAFRDGPRGNEIADWLKKNPVAQYAIVDDDSDMLENQMSNFYQTDGYVGLNWRDSDKIINHFGGKRS